MQTKKIAIILATNLFFISLIGLITPGLLQSNISNSLNKDSSKGKFRTMYQNIIQINNNIDCKNETTNSSAQILINSFESQGKTKQLTDDIIVGSKTQENDSIIDLKKRDPKTNFSKADAESLIVERGSNYIRLTLGHNAHNKLYGYKKISGVLSFTDAEIDYVINDPNHPFEKKEDAYFVKNNQLLFKSYVFDDTDSILVYYKKQDKLQQCQEFKGHLKDTINNFQESLLSHNWKDDETLDCTSLTKVVNNQTKSFFGFHFFCNKNKEFCADYKLDVDYLQKNLHLDNIKELISKSDPKQCLAQSKYKEFITSLADTEATYKQHRAPAVFQINRHTRGTLW